MHSATTLNHPTHLPQFFQNQPINPISVLIQSLWAHDQITNTQSLDVWTIYSKSRVAHNLWRLLDDFDLDTGPLAHNHTRLLFMVTFSHTYSWPAQGHSEPHKTWIKLLTTMQDFISNLSRLLMTWADQGDHSWEDYTRMRRQDDKMTINSPSWRQNLNCE